MGSREIKGLQYMAPATGSLHVWQLFPAKKLLLSFSSLLKSVAELLNSPVSSFDTWMIQILSCKAQRGSKEVKKTMLVQHRAKSLACVSMLQPRSSYFLSSASSPLAPSPHHLYHHLQALIWLIGHILFSEFAIKDEWMLNIIIAFQISLGSLMGKYTELGE